MWFKILCLIHIKIYNYAVLVNFIPIIIAMVATRIFLTFDLHGHMTLKNENQFSHILVADKDNRVMNFKKNL